MGQYKGTPKQNPFYKFEKEKELLLLLFCCSKCKKNKSK